MERLKHIAIIMDGNGRWALSQGKARTWGHKSGADNVTTIADYANEIGIKKLTLFAFSTENWKRPDDEKNYLFKLFEEMFNKHLIKLMEKGIKLTVIGDITKFSKNLQEIILSAEEKSKDNQGLELVLALNYGGRQEIISNTIKYAKDCLEKNEIIDTLEFERSFHSDVDIMIRTSGEQRLSNFLLWECAYAEFFFVKEHWPAFTVENLQDVINQFNKRNRRFGGLDERSA